MASRWTIYAIGGGMGHLTRALALARAAERRGNEIRILSNCPYARTMFPGIAFAPAGDGRGEAAGEILPLCRLHLLDPALGTEATSRAVRDIMAREPFAALIVDTFPRGIVGELAETLPNVKTPRVLVHRCLNPEYVRKHRIEEAVGSYDLLLVPGERAAFDGHPKSRQTAPWLVRDHGELLAFESAREKLQAKGDARPLALVSGCGRLDEIEEMAGLADDLRARLADEAAVRFAAPLPSRPATIAHFPLLELLGGVNVLVSSGGYNTVNEARATRTPLLAFARTRLYDMQDLRLGPGERVADHAALAVRVREAIGVQESVERTIPPFENGVHEAVAAIEALL